MATERRGSTLWRHRDFMSLWSGQAVSEMGSSVTTLALPMVAVVTLHASTFAVGLLSAATNLAFLVIALPAGAIVDRLSKRPLMLWCDLARVLVIGSVPVIAVAGRLTMTQLYLVAVAAGVLTVFFDVAYQSYVPVLVTRAQLIEANGKLGTTQSFAQVTGPSIGAGLVGAFGAARTMAADALSYLVSTVSLLLITMPESATARAGPPEGSRPKLRAEIREGLSFVIRHPVLRKVVACTGTANLFGSMAYAIQLVYLIRVLRVPPTYTGLLLSLGSVGGVVGGIAHGPLSRRIGSARLIWVSMLLTGLPALLVPLAQPGWGVLLFSAGSFAFSLSGVLYNTSQLSYRQVICPPDLLGRMNASVRWIVWGTLPLGGLLGGILGAAVGVRATVCLGVVGTILAGLWVLFSPLRTMRDVPVHDAYREDAEPLVG